MQTRPRSCEPSRLLTIERIASVSDTKRVRGPSICHEMTQLVRHESLVNTVVNLYVNRVRDVSI